MLTGQVTADKEAVLPLEIRNVLVLESEGGTLIGMSLLDGCRVVMDVEEGGVVSVESLAKIRGVN